MATISYNLDIETSRGYKKILDLHNQANQLFAKGVTLRLNNDFSRPLGKITGDVKEFNSSLDAATARVLAFTSTTTILYSVGAAMKRLVQDAVGVEDALAKIQAITLSSNSSMKGLGESLFKVANATGTSFYEVAKGAEEFSRQGLSAAESLKAVTAAANLARISGTDLKDSIGGLVSIISTFSAQALEYSQVVGILASVDAEFSTSASGLVEAIKRVGGVAAEAGIEIQNLAALIASTKQLTGRSESVIGNGLKSILTNLKTDGVQSALRAVGVETKDAAGNFRDLIEVLKDYQKVSQNLTPQKKADTDLKIAGKYQINTLSGITRSLDESSGKSLYAKGQDAANPDEDLLKRRVELLNSTTQTKQQVLQNNITELGAGVGKEALKPALDAVINFFNESIKQLNGFADKYSEVFKGLGDVFSGPVLLTGLAAIISLSVKLGVEISGVLKSLLSFGDQGKKNLEIQNTINAAFQNGDKFLVSQVRNASTLVERQVALNKLLQDYLNSTKSAKEFQLLDVGLVNAGTRKRIGNKASGSIPNGFEAAFAREQIQIESGVGGASRNAKPLLKNLNLSGVTEPVVVNSEEVIVRNFLGTGRDSVLNRNMIKRIGKSKLSQIGDVENLAIGRTPLAASNAEFGGPDITSEDAKKLFKSLQELRRQISQNPGSVPIEQRAAINRTLDSFSRQSNSGRFGNIPSVTTPGINPSDKFFNNPVNRQQLVIANNRLQAELVLTRETVNAAKAKSEEVRIAKQVRVEEALNRKLAIDSSANILTTVKDVRDISKSLGGGRGPGPRAVDTSSFENAALKRESQRFYRELELKASQSSSKGVLFRPSQIDKAYANASFTGTAAEKATFLKPIVDEFKNLSAQALSSIKADRLKQGAARAEFQLNKDIAAKVQRPTLFGQKILPDRELSNKEIDARVTQLSSKFKLNPSQSSQLNVYKDQIFQQRAQQSASRNQGLLLAGSFAVPFITGIVSKAFEENYTDAQGKTRSRETKSSRLVSGLGEAASGALTAGFIAKQLLPRLALPLAVGAAALQTFRTISQNINNTDLSRDDNSLKNEKSKGLLDNKAKFFAKRAEISASTDYQKTRILKSDLKEISSNLSVKDVTELDAVQKDKEFEYLNKEREKTNRRNSSRNFSSNIDSIFSNAAADLSVGDKLSQVLNNAFKGEKATALGQRGFVFGERYDDAGRVSSNYDSINIKEATDQLSRLANNVNYDKLSPDKLGKISSATKFKDVRDVLVNPSLGVSGASIGLNKIVEQASSIDQAKLLTAIQEAIKQGYENAEKEKKKTKEDKEKDKKDKLDAENNKFRVSAALKAIDSKSTYGGINLNRKSALSALLSDSEKDKDEILKARGSLSGSKESYSNYKSQSESLSLSVAEAVEKLNVDLTSSITNIISKNASDKDKDTLLSIIKNKGVDNLLNGTNVPQNPFLPQSSANTNYNKLLSSIGPQGGVELNEVLKNFSTGKETLSVNSSSKSISNINEFVKSNELRKIEIDKARENQLTSFGGFTDPIKYNSGEARADAVKRVRDEINLGQNPGGIGQADYYRKKYQGIADSLSSDPNLLELPSDATQSQIDFQNTYKNTKRADVSLALNESYQGELKDKTLASVGESLNSLDAFQRKNPTSLSLFNSEQRAGVAEKVKYGDYSGAKDIVSNQIELSQELPKERRDEVNKYLNSAFSSLDKADKSSSLTSERADAEAKKLIPEANREGNDVVEAQIKRLLAAKKELEDSLANTAGSGAQEYNVNVTLDGFFSSSEFSDKIKNLVSEEAKRLINANIGGPAIIPPAPKK